MADPSHVDLSVLWVPIMPETSGLDQAMETAGKDAKESFGKGSEGLGDKIHESVTKSKDKIKDVFQRTGKDANDAMADAIKENSKKVEDAVEDTGKKAKGKFRESAKGWGKVLVDAVGPDTQKLLGDRLEEVVGGSLEGVLGERSKFGGQLARSVADWGFDELKTKLGGVKDAADKTKAAFADFKSGDTQAGVSKLVDSFGKLGIEAKDLPAPIKDVVDKTSDAKTAAEEFASVFTNLPGKIGTVASKIGELAGPIAALGSAIWTLRDQEKAGLFDKTDSSGHEDWWKLAGGVGGSWLEDKYNRVFHGHGTPGAGGSPGVDMGGVTGIGAGGDVLGSGQDAYDAFTSGAPVSGPGASVSEPPTSTPSAVSAPSSFVGSMPDSFSSPADLHAGGSRIANLYKVANALQGTPYSQALRNDCSGMVSKLATAALGMSPSVQFSTVNEGDWLMSHGFKPGMGGPGDLSVGWYDHGGGNAGHTAATLPGGEHAESGGAHGNFLVGAGAAGANDPQFTNHAYLPMGGSGKTPPLGSKDDPIFTSFADSGASSGGQSEQDALSQGFGANFLHGIGDSLGLGSVFKGFGGASNPMDFGITKLGTGLLNWSMGAAHGAAGAVPNGPAGSQSVRSGDTYHVDNSMTVNQTGVQDGITDWQHAGNAAQNRVPAMTAPNAGGVGVTP